MARDYKQEYDALAHAIVGDTGLSAILEAGRHMKAMDALRHIQTVAARNHVHIEDADATLHGIGLVCAEALS